MNKEQAINKIIGFLKEYEKLCQKYEIGIDCHDDEDWLKADMCKENDDYVQLYTIRYDDKDNCILCNDKRINELKEEDFVMW